MFVPSERIKIVVDDTVTERPRPKVYGKGRHQDPVISSHPHTAFKWRHKWIVVSLLVRLPFSVKPFALPVMVALYRPKDWNEAHGYGHKTPVEITIILLKKLVLRFPDRHFVVVGDSGFSTNAMAVFCHKHRKSLTPVGKLPSNANLYGAAPKRTKGTNGKPRKKGKKLPSPRKAAEKAENKTIMKGWAKPWFIFP